MSPTTKPLTPRQIFETARRAGFPLVPAIMMTAIALRESAGVPDAFNGNLKTGDESYGLWQINWLVPQVRTVAKSCGVTDPQSLKDPSTNAKVAFALYAGKRTNLNVAWYIDHPGDYQTRYLAHLPVALDAAMESLAMEPKV